MLFKKQKPTKVSAEAMQILQQAKAVAQIIQTQAAYLAAKIDGVDLKKNWRMNSQTMMWEPAEAQDAKGNPEN